MAVAEFTAGMWSYMENNGAPLLLVSQIMVKLASLLYVTLLKKCMQVEVSE